MNFKECFLYAVVLCSLLACGDTDSEQELALLQEEIEDLEQQLMLSDKHITDFSLQYRSVTASLDSISRTSDSLQRINAVGGTFDQDSLLYYRSQFSFYDSVIIALEAKLTLLDTPSEVVDLLRYQLNRTKGQLYELQIENERLTSQNDSIKRVLAFTKNELQVVIGDLQRSESELEDQEAAFQLETQRRERIMQERNAEIARLEQMQSSMITAAEAAYGKALVELQNLDPLIKTRRNGSYKIKDRDLPNAKRMIASAVQHLTDAKRQGLTEANDLLDEIYRDEKYASIRPLQ
ncbi:MAG: hypothetical protein AAFP77_02015 [Bacteroidota bacterium]